MPVPFETESDLGVELGVERGAERGLDLIVLEPDLREEALEPELREELELREEARGLELREEERELGLGAEARGLDLGDDCILFGPEDLSPPWAQVAGAVPTRIARAIAIGNGPRVGWNLLVAFNIRV